MDILVTVLWFLLSAITLIPLIYWHLTRKFNYWSNKGVKGPKPVPIFGTNIYGLITPLPTLEMKWIQKYGKIYGLFASTKPVLTIAEPNLIKTILVKDFHLFTDRRTRPIFHPILDKNLLFSRGEYWKRLRSIVSPTFTSGKMRKMYPKIRECLDEFLNHLEPLAKERKDINLKDMHGKYTMDVIATCAFATKTNSYSDPNDPFVMYAKEAFNFSLVKIIALFLMPDVLRKILNIQSPNNSKANDFFIELTRHIVRDRKKQKSNSNKYNDLIQLLVDSQKDEDIHDVNDVNESHHVNEGEEEINIEKKTLAINVVNKQLTEDEMAAQGWIFFIAGYETTASTLTFCSYELALNPEIQETLYEEIQNAVDSDGEISYEELAKLPFLDSVLSETLRLYTPVIRLDRKVSTDYNLGDTGIKLFKGQDIEIPVYAIHHSEEYYPNANQFIPNRFMPENRHQIIPYTYLPFGAGPRNCIGMRFALMEAKLGLAHIVRRYRFFRSEQTAVPLQYKKSRLLAAKSVVVGIEKRF